MSILSLLSLNQISLSLTEKEFLFVRLNFSNTVSDARMDAETKGPPTKVTRSPIAIVIITVGSKILNADFPEAFRMGISFEFDSHEKVSIELNIIISAMASNVSIGILKKIFNNALFASRPLDEKKLSWSDPSIKSMKKSTVSRHIPRLWRYLMEI